MAAADGTRRKKAFAKRLNALIGEQALTSKAIADRMQRELDGEKFNVVNLSHYRAGRSLPRTRYLNALSRAVGVSADVLLMSEADVAGDEPTAANGKGERPAVRIEARSEGEAFLEINLQLPWSRIIRVMRALKEDA